MGKLKDKDLLIHLCNPASNVVLGIVRAQEFHWSDEEGYFLKYAGRKCISQIPKNTYESAIETFNSDI